MHRDRISSHAALTAAPMSRYRSRGLAVQTSFPRRCGPARPHLVRRAPARSGPPRASPRHRPYTPADAAAGPSCSLALLAGACVAAAGRGGRRHGPDRSRSADRRSTRPRPATPAARRSSRQLFETLTTFDDDPRAAAGPRRVVAHRGRRPADRLPAPAGPRRSATAPRCVPRMSSAAGCASSTRPRRRRWSTPHARRRGRRWPTSAGDGSADDVGLTADDAANDGHRRPRPAGRRLRRRSSPARRSASCRRASAATPTRCVPGDALRGQRRLSTHRRDAERR